MVRLVLKQRQIVRAPRLALLPLAEAGLLHGFLARHRKAPARTEKLRVWGEKSKTLRTQRRDKRKPKKAEIPAREIKEFFKNSTAIKISSENENLKNAPLET